MPRPLIGITVSRRKSSSGERDLYGVLYPYVDAVRGQGGLPVLIPLGLQAVELRDLYDRVDGLVFSGGGDIHPEHYGYTLTDHCTRIDPERDEMEFTLVRWAAGSRGSNYAWLRSASQWRGHARACHRARRSCSGHLDR